MSVDLTDGKELTTFGGVTLTVVVVDGIISITGPGNTVTVTRADITDCNSVIHETDGLLLPTVRSCPAVSTALTWSPCR